MRIKKWSLKRPNRVSYGFSEYEGEEENKIHPLAVTHYFFDEFMFITDNLLILIISVILVLYFLILGLFLDLLCLPFKILASVEL